MKKGTDPGREDRPREDREAESKKEMTICSYFYNLLESCLMQQKKISFVSLGCFKNTVDTEILAGLLNEEGVEIVSEYEDPDWLVINTCAFIRDAKEESNEEILAALERKSMGDLTGVAVFGCLGERYAAEIKQLHPQLDIVWGVNDLPGLARVIAGRSKKKYCSDSLYLHNAETPRIHTLTPNTAFVKISEGCDMGCSFCAIPSIRGPFRSRPMADVLSEVLRYREMGVTEINLVSQNSTAYGRDLHRPVSLAELIESVSELELPWIRPVYLMPETVDDRLIESFKKPGVLPYFDLPFQHVSCSVLKNMRRGGGYEENLSLVEKIRKTIPGAVFRCSFIAGFPGETEEEFEQLLSFIKEAGIEYVGAFAYSDEEGTDSFKLPGKLDESRIWERVERLREQGDEQLQGYFNSLHGKEFSFLPLGPWDNGSTIGRIDLQAPEIDGLTQLSQPFDEESWAPLRVRITGHECELLTGESI